MPSSLSEKIGYLRERARNAYAMLRRGEFGLMAEGVRKELSLRGQTVREKARHHAVITTRTAKISARQAQHRLRQITASQADVPPEQAHFDEAPVDQVIPDSAFRNSRKLVPASPCPTSQRVHAASLADDGTDALLDTLQSLADAVKPSNAQ